MATNESNTNTGAEEIAPGRVASTPGAAALAANESRVKAINAEPDFWSEGPKTKALRDEMKRLAADPGVVAKQDQAKTEAEAKLSPAERRRQELTKELTTGKLTDAERAAKSEELRRLLAASDTKEEREALVAEGVTGARALFGLEAPRDVTALGKDAAAAYEEGFADHEADLLRHARAEGWDKKLAGDIREHGVRLGMEIAARGTGMTAGEEQAFRDAFKDRLSKAQQDQLVGWFKKDVIGAA